jgi:GH24 family phage-related lysozyme (muramidase)
MNYEKLVKSIKENEGLSLTVYDCPAGKKTIGY